MLGPPGAFPRASPGNHPARAAAGGAEPARVSPPPAAPTVSPSRPSPSPRSGLGNFTATFGNAAELKSRGPARRGLQGWGPGAAAASHRSLAISPALPGPPGAPRPLGTPQHQNRPWHQHKAFDCWGSPAMRQVSKGPEAQAAGCSHPAGHWLERAVQTFQPNSPCTPFSIDTRVPQLQLAEKGESVCVGRGEQVLCCS